MAKTDASSWRLLVQAMDACVADVNTNTQALQVVRGPRPSGDTRKKLFRSGRRAAAKGKQTLDEMKARVDASEADPESRQTSQHTIMRNQYERAVQVYLDCLKANQATQSEMYEAAAKDLVDQAAPYYPGASADAIVAAVNAEEASDVATGAYALVRARAEEVEAIAHSVAELKDIFTDVLTLLQHQRTQVITIEDNINRAAQHVKKGNKQVEGAIKKHKRKRWCQCLVLTIVVVLITIAALLGGLLS